MGSKKPILDFITKSIAEIHIEDNFVCDLFAGSCSISAALRNRYNFISNDIQEYSEVLANTYFSNFAPYDSREIIDDIDRLANIHSLSIKKQFHEYLIDYSSIKSVRDYAETELHQRELMDKSFDSDEFHLFSKYYSGTYWSFEQCTWIDALRKAAEQYSNTPIKYCVLSSLMYAMAYTSQSTGHFAQYRDGIDSSSMNDILLYRNKNLFDLFKKKFIELILTLNVPTKTLYTSSLDYTACLEIIPDRTTVYADPPYAPVHYSRFYHALETLVRYDYPELKFKGRYRTDRHQSPFSKKGTVVNAFVDLFEKIINRDSQMVLSYSNSGVINIDTLIELARNHFKSQKYSVFYETLNYSHSTMGRADDKEREVIEYLVIAKLN